MKFFIVSYLSKRLKVLRVPKLQYPCRQNEIYIFDFLGHHLLPCLILWILSENLIYVFPFLGKIQYKKQVYFIVFQYMYIQSCKCKSLSVSISRFPSSLVIFFDLLCFGKKEILFQYIKFLFQYISNSGMFLNKLLFEFLLRPKMEYCLVCSILTAKDQSG